jgi:hypothetical protein
MLFGGEYASSMWLDVVAKFPASSGNGTAIIKPVAALFLRSELRWFGLK